MFPIVHFLLEKNVLKKDSPLLILGGALPDLASFMGWDRNVAHAMGADFWQWCATNRPDSADLARGIILHGMDPKGLDFYADEKWPGNERGWCFMLGEPFKNKVQKACNLPDKWALWKSHNFAEMCMELAANKIDPTLGPAIVAASQNEEALALASGCLAQYTGLPAEKIERGFRFLPHIFALEDVGPDNLIDAYIIQLERRHDIKSHNKTAMIEVLAEMHEECGPQLDGFLQKVEPKIAMALAATENTTN